MACPVIIPASAWLQGEIFLSEGQYLYSSFRIHFCLPWTECQVLILSVAFSLAFWFMTEWRSVFNSGGIFSSLHRLCAHVHHFLSGYDSSNTRYERVKACTRHSPDSTVGSPPPWGLVSKSSWIVHWLGLFLSIWVSHHVTGCISWNPNGEKWASGERRHLNANLRTFNSTSAFIFNLKCSALCFCLSCSDTWKQNQLHSVFPQVGLASQQAGETGVFIRYQTSLVVSVCIYIIDKHTSWWWHLFGFTSQAFWRSFTASW